MDITFGRVMKYALLPGILPRIRAFASSGFGYVSFFMAQIYRAARLIPPNHPYLNPANMGKFGVRHVVAEAAANLTLKKENVDQVFIFVMLLVGLVLLFAQFCMMALALFVQSAQAAPPMPTNFSGFFETTPPLNDIAFVLLDRVFGVPDFFNSCVAQELECFAKQAGVIAGTGEGPFPWPFHEALRSMMELYSIGLLVVAMIIFLYFIVTILAETAESGTPFGRRFNHVWAPLRMVAALGLLIPVANGLNAAQYIVLYAAKYGSGFATNGWNMFIDTAVAGTQTLLGETDQLVSVPNSPDINTLLEFFLTVNTCIVAQHDTYGRDIDAWLVRETGDNPYNSKFLDVAVAGSASGGLAMTAGFTPSTTYEAALDFYNQGDILIRFGEFERGADGEPIHAADTGFVHPFCGDVVLQTHDLSEPGSLHIQRQYYNMIAAFLADPFFRTNAVNIYMRYGADPEDPNAPLPTNTGLAQARQDCLDFLTRVIAQGVVLQVSTTTWIEDLRSLGWAGASIWYNKVAQMNGSMVGAAEGIPAVKLWPEIMEKVKKERLAHDGFVTGTDRFRPYLSDGKAIRLKEVSDTKIAKPLYQANIIWHSIYQAPSGNIFMDAIKALFGVDGLYNIRDNADKDIHPLAQLSSIGKALVDSAVRNLGYSGVGGALSVMSMFSNQLVTSVSMASSSFFTKIAMIGLLAGFIMFYVLPFLPFIYFFFAVGGWIKGIFEAMVGVPLWALAHIRIDGNGLPGDAAMGGYYLILEVFLRPIMIVFGLLAGIAIFSAQVRVLNEIWQQVTSNLAGFDAVVDGNSLTKIGNSTNPGTGETGSLEFKRDPLDQFFYTVIYAIVVYMLGMSSFKLVDLIPNHILRWMGAQAQTFGEQSSDPAENLIRNVSVGGGMIGSQLGQATSGMSGAIQNMSQRSAAGRAAGG